MLFKKYVTKVTGFQKEIIFTDDDQFLKAYLFPSLSYPTNTSTRKR